MSADRLDAVRAGSANGGEVRSGSHTIRTGDAVPHFNVTTVTGEAVSYSTIWQRQHLVLVSLPAGGSDGEGSYIAELTKRLPELTALDTACIMTIEPIAGIPRPSVIVADRWGEVVEVAAALHADALPCAREILAWVEHIRHRCPECEGESR